MTTQSSQDDPTLAHELAELKRQLQSQLTLLRDERLDELLDAMRHTTQQLHALTGPTPTNATFAAELTELRALHTELELTLADRLTDTRARLTHLNKGKHALRAYRG